MEGFSSVFENTAIYSRRLASTLLCETHVRGRRRENPVCMCPEKKCERLNDAQTLKREMQTLRRCGVGRGSLRVKVGVPRRVDLCVNFLAKVRGSLVDRDVFDSQPVML